MIRQSTIDKLHDMRLSAMSDAFECQCKDPDTYQGLSFEDRSVCWLIKNGISEKAQSCKNLSAVLNSVIPMRVWKILSITPDRNLDKGRCWEFSTCPVYI